MKKTFLALALAASFTTSVFAEGSTDNPSSFYVSAYAGQSNFDDTDTSGEYSIDDNDTALKFSLGYKFNDYFAIEAGYADLGELTLNASEIEYLDPGNYSNNYYSVEATASAEVSGLIANIVASFPINEQFSIYAKAGIFSWEVDLKASATAEINFEGTYDKVTESESSTEDNTDAFYGVGAKYHFERFSIQAEYEVYEANDADINVLSLGASFYF